MLQPFQAQPSRRVRAGAEGHSRIEDECDGFRVRRFVPGGDDPQTFGNADRLKLCLRDLHPVLFGDGFAVVRRRTLKPGQRRADSKQDVGIGCLIEQDNNARTRPAQRCGRAGFAELWLFGERAGINILNTDGQGAVFDERVGQPVGMLAVRFDRRFSS